MRAVRTLTLKKEALTELASAELAQVNGAQATWYCPYSLLQCHTQEISRAIDPCPTN
jgi:hypothetical protein